MTSLRVWEDLVLRRGWSGDQWVESTTAALEAAFVAPRPDGRLVDPRP